MEVTVFCDVWSDGAVPVLRKKPSSGCKRGRCFLWNIDNDIPDYTKSHPTVERSSVMCSFCAQVWGSSRTDGRAIGNGTLLTSPILYRSNGDSSFALGWRLEIDTANPTDGLSESIWRQYRSDAGGGYIYPKCEAVISKNFSFQTT
jgi:hypothetical protein